MAITLDTQILNQQATPTATYCYLYEPLRIVLSESDLTAQKFYIDLEIIDTANSTVVIETLVKYGDFDINPGKSLSIDLMKLVRQHHDAQVYNFSHIDEIVSSGYSSIVSKYRYNFLIYSDITFTPISVKKIPVIGGRAFKDFSPTVSLSQPLTEADDLGVDLNNRWIGYPFLETALSDPALQNATPSITKTTPAQGNFPCGGYLIWKSRLGGWMAWGFRIKIQNSKHKYSDNLQVGMFESTAEIGGSPYIPVDYTGIRTSYSINLKALSLTKEELEAVDGINSSPAVYYMKDSSGSLELMRMTSASVPLNNLANGGDFSVSLDSISTSEQKTR